MANAEQFKIFEKNLPDRSKFKCNNLRSFEKRRYFHSTKLQAMQHLAGTSAGSDICKGFRVSQVLQ